MIYFSQIAILKYPATVLMVIGDTQSHVSQVMALYLNLRYYLLKYIYIFPFLYSVGWSLVFFYIAQRLMQIYNNLALMFHL